MKKIYQIVSIFAVCGFFAGCGSEKHSDHSHDHGDGEPHVHDTAPVAQAGNHDHGEEVPLGTFNIGGISVAAMQAHGAVMAGKESHLVIKLPYNDKGASVVRVWIGVEDRTLSSVGKGEYAPSHDDYDIHTIAPNPLPAGSKWWVEIEKPDGTKAVGSIPLLKDK